MSEISTRPFAWSFSRLSSYELCSKRYYHYNIAKDIREPEDFAQSEGKLAHDAYHQRISKGKTLPMDLTYQEPILAGLAKLPGETHTELKLGLTKDFAPTGFFSDDIWFRTVADFCNLSEDRTRAVVVDYKTGKPSEDLTQVALLSATIFHYVPEVETVKARLMFMSHNKSAGADYVRNDVPKIWNDILPRVKKLEAAERNFEFPPNPGGLCVRYCAVTSCPFHGRGTGEARRF